METDKPESSRHPSSGKPVETDKPESSSKIGFGMLVAGIVIVMLGSSWVVSKLVDFRNIHCYFSPCATPTVAPVVIPSYSPKVYYTEVPTQPSIAVIPSATATLLPSVIHTQASQSPQEPTVTIIPIATTIPPSPTPCFTPMPNYTVQPGDTLSYLALSEYYDERQTRIAEIMATNCLDNDIIVAGNGLYLFRLPPPPTPTPTPSHTPTPIPPPPPRPKPADTPTATPTPATPK